MVKNNVKLNHVTIGNGAYRNFAGEKGRYNQMGRRTFVILLDEERGRRMEERGWQLQWREPRNDEDERVAKLTAECRFGTPYPIKVTLITEGGTTELDESNISLLDTADIANCDVLLRPYNWDETGKYGAKAMVEEMEVTLNERVYDEL